MTKAELVPLTHNPRFVHYELSGATLVGAMARTHYGYQVRSTMELRDLKKRIGEVQVAVLSCGSVLKLEPKSRLARLIHESKSKKTYERVVTELQDKKVVGDLLYHFLRADGGVEPMPSISRSLETAKIADLYPKDPRKAPPTVYSASPEVLADIAQRGVSLLLVHSEERARLACAALRRVRKPINFIVTSRAAAEQLLKL